MSRDGVAASKASQRRDDALSRALTSVLQPSLLRPLIDIVADFARAADWSRATVEVLQLTTELSTPCGLLVDSDRGRVLFTDYRAGRLLSMAVDDLPVKPADPSVSVSVSVSVRPPIAVTRVAGPSGPSGSAAIVTTASECLHNPWSSGGCCCRC
jgi:hypothetical protein